MSSGKGVSEFFGGVIIIAIAIFFYKEFGSFTNDSLRNIASKPNRTVLDKALHIGVSTKNDIDAIKESLPAGSNEGWKDFWVVDYSTYYNGQGGTLSGFRIRLQGGLPGWKKVTYKNIKAAAPIFCDEGWQGPINGSDGRLYFQSNNKKCFIELNNPDGADYLIVGDAL